MAGIRIAGTWPMTTEFALDERLQQDCIRIGEWRECLLLLMNNSLVPWFILVPKTRVTELHQLPAGLRAAVDSNIDELSQLLLNEFAVTKLNVAAIGNVVSQLHIHVIGRHPDDYCWPGVVWGRPEREPYSDSEAAKICQTLQTALQLEND